MRHYGETFHDGEFVGTLENALLMHPDMSPSQRLKFAADVAAGLDHLRACDIVHGAVCPAAISVRCVPGRIQDLTTILSSGAGRLAVLHLDDPTGCVFAPEAATGTKGEDVDAWMAVVANLLTGEHRRLDPTNLVERFGTEIGTNPLAVACEAFRHTDCEAANFVHDEVARLFGNFISMIGPDGPTNRGTDGHFITPLIRCFTPIIALQDTTEPVPIDNGPSTPTRATTLVRALQSPAAAVNLCTICMDCAPDARLHPCNHTSICVGCATRVIERAQSGPALCPFCSHRCRVQRGRRHQLTALRAGRQPFRVFEKISGKDAIYEAPEAISIGGNNMGAVRSPALISTTVWLYPLRRSTASLSRPKAALAISSRRMRAILRAGTSIVANA